MSEARWVAATSATGEVKHAVWVTYSEVTEPKRVNGQWVYPQRPGESICGVSIPHVTAGPNHGHDWDRTASRERCINCVIALRKAANEAASRHL